MSFLRGILASLLADEAGEIEIRPCVENAFSCDEILIFGG
jgi:hypothetical protein